MSPLQIAVLDDTPHPARAVQEWLHESDIDALTTAEVWPYDSVLGLEADLADHSIELDLILIDLVLQTGSYGGLKAIALAEEHRPDTPVVVYSALENNGDRFLYGLAAAAWFGPQVRAIIPKAFPDARTAGRHFSHQLANAASSQPTPDPVLDFLRSGDICTKFNRELLRDHADLIKWRAIQRQAMQAPAAQLAGVAPQTLRDWETKRLDVLDYLWDEAANTPLGAQRGRFARSEQGGYGDPHGRLRDFITQQYAFWADPYLDERFPA